MGKTIGWQRNRLAFWIALPALVFRAAAHAGTPTLGTLLLIGVITAATILTALLTWGIARGAQIAAPARSTFIAPARSPRSPAWPSSCDHLIAGIRPEEWIDIARLRSPITSNIPA
jgi:hypothetical protein